MSGLRTTLLSIALVTSPILVAGSAAAQDELEPEDAELQEPAAEVEDAAVEPAASESRFRFGIAGAGGPLMGGYTGGAGGVAARFGMQLDSLLGVYAQPILLVGAGVSADAQGASATGLALYGVGALADATFADMFYVGGGPELLLGAVGEAESTTAGSSASGATGPFFSLALRTGFAFGSARPNRRKAFTVGLDMHVVFAGDAAVLPLIALGYEAY